MSDWTCPGCGVPRPQCLRGCTHHEEIEILRAEIARLREERRWVSVGERLPEPGSLVLAFINGEVMEATFCGGGGLAWQTDRGGFNATHWQPLPSGPEANG